MQVQSHRPPIPQKTPHKHALRPVLLLSCTIALTQPLPSNAPALDVLGAGVGKDEGRSVGAPRGVKASSARFFPASLTRSYTRVHTLVF